MAKYGALLACLLLASAAPAQAKSYHFGLTQITAEVRPDAVMHVQEVRDYVFRGSFSEAWRQIPLEPGETVENFVLSENGAAYEESALMRPGTVMLRPTADGFEATWFYSARDETRRFVLEYDVIGAVQKHADFAELHWQFIGADAAVGSDTTVVALALPDGIPADDIRAWGHGPLWGSTDIEDSSVTFTCDPLPPRTMLEARVLFPSQAIVGGVPELPIEILPYVLEEESRQANEANWARRKARLSWLIPIALILLGVGIWVSLYLRHGREYEEENPVEYLREPPDEWTPNQVSFLWHWGKLTPQDMTATVMDLVRRGALRLIVNTEEKPVLGGLLGERTEQEYVIERVPDFDGEIAASERHLINSLLFHGVRGDMISLETFQKNAQRDPTGSRSRFKQWESMAKKEAKTIAVVEPISKKMSGIGTAVGLLLFLSVFVLAPVFENPVAFVLGVVGFALIPASFAIMRRTPEAARKLHEWQAFRRYLTDFSRLSEHPAPAVILWERYLVYAITLGVADRVIEQFRELYPQLAEKAETSGAFAHWVSAGGQPLRGISGMTGAFSSINRSIATATSSFSSSSGRGGGFSGGGGGGGGGGSVGAR